MSDKKQSKGKQMSEHFVYDNVIPLIPEKKCPTCGDSGKCLSSIAGRIEDPYEIPCPDCTEQKQQSDESARKIELIPDVKYKVDPKSMIRMYEPGKVQQQTEDLRKAVKVIITTIEFQKRIGYTEEQVKDICGDFIDVLEQINGKPYKG